MRDSLCQAHFSTAWHASTDGKPWQEYPKPLTLLTYNNNIIENYYAWPNSQILNAVLSIKTQYKLAMNTNDHSL